MTWLVIAVVLAAAAGAPRLFVFGVLFPAALRIRRLRRLHYLLSNHCAAYRRWCRQQFILSMRRLEKAIGKELLPAVKKATAALDDWARALTSPVDDVRAAFRDA